MKRIVKKVPPPFLSPQYLTCQFYSDMVHHWVSFSLYGLTIAKNIPKYWNQAVMSSKSTYYLLVFSCARSVFQLCKFNCVDFEKTEILVLVFCRKFWRETEFVNYELPWTLDYKTVKSELKKMKQCRRCLPLV